MLVVLYLLPRSSLCSKVQFGRSFDVLRSGLSFHLLSTEGTEPKPLVAHVIDVIDSCYIRFYLLMEIWRLKCNWMKIT